MISLGSTQPFNVFRTLGLVLGLELGLAFPLSSVCVVSGKVLEENGQVAGPVGWRGLQHCSESPELGCLNEQLDLTGVCPSELALSLQQCEQLVAELQGNVRQAVQLYRLVSTGQQAVGRQPVGSALCFTAERTASGFSYTRGWGSTQKYPEKPGQASTPLSIGHFWPKTGALKIGL